jgi:hypothetical protein
MKKNSKNTTAAANPPASSPDFKREICAVVRDKSGREIMRSAPLFSAVEAERIGDAGAEEYLTLSLEPADGVQYPGMRWDSRGFYWIPENSAATVTKQESGV